MQAAGEHVEGADPIENQTLDKQLLPIPPTQTPQSYPFMTLSCPSATLKRRERRKEVNELQDEWDRKKGCPFWRQTQVIAH